MLDIWREKAEIRFGNVDRSDRLTLGGIFSFFQEAAISHAANLGVGRDALARTGQAWVLSRLSLFVKRRPSYGETVEVSTWPRGWEKLFALRDYEIRDEAGGAIVRGRGGWLVLDMEKRRPLRAQTVMERLPLNDGVNAFPSGPAPLAAKETLEKRMERRVLYSDIDFYGHANNARYIQWIQDASDPETLAAADQVRLDINYLSEAMPGDTVELWTAPLAPDCLPAAGGSPEGDYPEKPGPGFVYEGKRPAAGGMPANERPAVFRAELRTGIF